MHNQFIAMSIGAALFVMTLAIAEGSNCIREEFRTATADGFSIHVREIGVVSTARAGEPVILIHGARVPGAASFDLDVPGGSLAADLATALGRAVYMMDVRGYGGSDRPSAMDLPADRSRPLVRAYEAVRDIDAVVRDVMHRTGAGKVALFGWAAGGMWAAYYASLWPERVGHLVTLNALYGGSNGHPALGPGSSNADPEQPERLSGNIGGYALNDAGSLFPSWDRTIPVADKTTWRDQAVAEAYAAAALASDPLSAGHEPPAFRAPLGAIEDSFYQACGRRLYDAASITAPVLVIRSELDFWSRPEDAQAFAHDAMRSQGVQVVTLADATHYVHLDRAERGRDALLHEVVQFLGGGASGQDDRS